MAEWLETITAYWNPVKLFSKKKGSFVHATTWMNPQGIMPSEKILKVP